jgi:hypothetical protein
MDSVREFFNRLRGLLAIALANAELLEQDPDLKKLSPDAQEAVHTLADTCRELKELISEWR